MTLLPVWAINKETQVKTQLASCEGGHMFFASFDTCPFCERNRILRAANTILINANETHVTKLAKIKSILDNPVTAQHEALCQIREALK